MVCPRSHSQKRADVGSEHRQTRHQHCSSNHHLSISQRWRETEESREIRNGKRREERKRERRGGEGKKEKIKRREG